MDYWEAYSLLEPFGHEMHNLFQANICMASIAPYSKSTPKLSDWYLDFIEKHEKAATSDPKQMEAILNRLI